MTTQTALPSYESAADVAAAAARMHEYFTTGATLPIEHRKDALRRLKAWLKTNEERVLSALQEDLGKAPFEGYATELGIVYEEINLCLGHIGSWTRPAARAHAHHAFPFVVEGLSEPLRRSLGAQPVELPPAACARAAGGRACRRQLRGAQAFAHLACDEHAALRNG